MSCEDLRDIIKLEEVEQFGEKSLVTTPIVDFAYRYLQNTYNCDSVLFLSPDIVFLIQNLIFALNEQSHTFSSELISMKNILAKFCIKTKKLVFFPLTNRNRFGDHSHWSLLAFWPSKSIFYHFDSLSWADNEQHNSQSAYELYKMLLKLIPVSKSKFREFNSIRQKNHFDCGIYMIATSEYLINSVNQNCISKYLDGMVDMINSDYIAKYRKDLKRECLNLYRL